MMASEPRSSFIVSCTLLYPSSLRVLRELKAYIRQSKSEKSFCWEWELWPKPQCKTHGTFDQIIDGPSFLSWLGLKTLSHKPLVKYWNFPERLTKTTNVNREGSQFRKTEEEPSPVLAGEEDRVWSRLDVAKWAPSLVGAALLHTALVTCMDDRDTPHWAVTFILCALLPQAVAGVL